MKISKLFHFLYFSVMALPLVLIPIFAIYSMNHEINDNSIIVPENKEVVFNQVAKFQQRGSTAYILNDSEITLNTTGNVYPRFDMEYWVNNHKYIIYPYSSDTIATLNLNISKTNSQTSTLTSITQNQYTAFTYDSSNVDYVYLGFGNTNGIKLYVNLFDLTYMFGEGNEPTIIEFTHYYNENTYPFIVNEIQYIPLYEQIYNDTDIMSQFLYCQYNAMDKYLGMYKYEPFNSIYVWTTDSFFGGNAPLIYTIFYQMFSYWLFVSLAWLVFDVLMYVPMVAHRWLDKGALQ